MLHQLYRLPAEPLTRCLPFLTPCSTDMAVTNLVKDQNDDHAKRMALFASEVMKAAEEVPVDPEDSSLGFIQLRVGFHSGPVVAE